MKKLNAIIIGGTKGIGLAITENFLKEKKIVHVISRNRNLKLENRLRKQFANSIFFYNCDATNLEEFSLIRNNILDNSNGNIDIIVSNVGNGSGSLGLNQDNNEWNYSWSVNFDSAYNSYKIFIEDIIETKGVITFISSIAGIEDLGAPISYSVAKSSVISLSKSISKRVGANVRVNTVAPGNIITKDGTWDLKMQKNPSKIKKMLREKVPLRRFGKPQEVADLISFLSSDKAKFITGACIVIDGGQTNKLNI